VKKPADTNRCRALLFFNNLIYNDLKEVDLRSKTRPNFGRFQKNLTFSPYIHHQNEENYALARKATKR
jgi:hypothetical protein